MDSTLYLNQLILEILSNQSSAHPLTNDMKMALIEFDKDLRMLIDHFIPRNPFHLASPLQEINEVATVSGYLQHTTFPILLKHAFSLFEGTTPNRNILRIDSLYSNSPVFHLFQLIYLTRLLLQILGIRRFLLLIHQCFVFTFEKCMILFLFN